MDLHDLLQENGSKLVLCVLDGLGGAATAEQPTELEAAESPNLDRLAVEGITGMVEPLGAGITVGSGPGHLALFGYDPQQFELGRGTLSAAGLGITLTPGDVAARGNLCTLDDDGLITDRRAGRPDAEEGERLTQKLREGVRLDGAEAEFHHVAEHRVLLVLRGEGLDPRLADTDPQETGVPPLEVRPLAEEAESTAELVTELVRQVREALAGERGNGLVLRGFDTSHELPDFTERYGVRAATVAAYPMYRGVASLVGMDVLGAPHSLDEQVTLLREHWDDYDYFFWHHKATDSAGHDGDREAKIAAVEAFDGVVPDLVELAPDVIVVSGDHASPAQFSGHSWHPVPTLLRGGSAGVDEVERFGERWCRGGALGLRPTTALMPLMLAAAGRLAKYGA